MIEWVPEKITPKKAFRLACLIFLLYLIAALTLFVRSSRTAQPQPHPAKVVLPPLVATTMTSRSEAPDAKVNDDINIISVLSEPEPETEVKPEPIRQPLVLSQSGFPPGFEDLFSPQRSMVDIYFGGRFITTASATFTFDSIEFDDSVALVGKIPDILDPFPVIKALEGELDSHAEKLCHDRRTNGCGILEPEVAAVLFDADQFRADVFIHPDLLATTALNKSRHLPGSDAGVSVIQNLTANVSGNLNSQNSSDNYTFFGKSFLSFEENSLQADWDISRDQDVSVSQIMFERDFEGRLWQTGLVNTTGFGLNFSNSRRLWGARVASSFNTRTDQSLTRGTPLDIFMPVSGRFEIIYEDRLISSGMVESGNQTLDTSNFPGGAYDITIRLLDDQGNLLREETRFFARQTRLAPIGEKEYFLEGGRVSQTSSASVFPELTDDVLVRSGVNMRMADTLSGSFALAATEGQGLGEATFFKIGRRYELAPALMLSSDGGYGGKVDGRYRWGDLNLNANYQQLWRKNIRPVDDFDLLGDGFRQVSFSAHYPLLGGSSNYRYGGTKRSAPNTGLTTHQIRQSLGYSRTVYRDGLYSISMRFDTSWTNEGQVSGLLSFDLSRSQNNWTFRTTPQARYDKNTAGSSDREERLQVSASYNGRDRFAGDFTSTIRAETQPGRNSAGLSSRYASTWGAASLNVNHAQTSGSSSTGYSGSMSTSFMANRDVLAFGGETQSRSAIVVTMDGAALGDRFDVLVNGQRRGYALGGKPSVIQLSPFRTYRVSVRSSGNSLFSFDEREHELTLYPGNVMDLSYQVDLVRLLYGRVRTSDGEWLAHASVQGGVGLALSDEYGLFQAEIAGNTDSLTFIKDNRQCKLELELKNNDNDIINLGQVACHYLDDSETGRQVISG